MQLCGSLNILWHCLSLGLEWKLTFSSPVATGEFSKFLESSKWNKGISIMEVMSKPSIHNKQVLSWVQFSSVAQSYLILCDPMDCSTLGIPVHPQLPELTQMHGPSFWLDVKRQFNLYCHWPQLLITLVCNKKEGGSNQKLIYMGKGYVRGSNHQRN